MFFSGRNQKESRLYSSTDDFRGELFGDSPRYYTTATGERGMPGMKREHIAEKASGVLF
ncbi:hypothetical protein [Paenibacillus polymyxa]|jgi:hypothetical protein|uniref:hypothetical protein n=1 Tax=Paenibacillus polymyxa TaxID=1406 RepID=UPI001ABB2A6E|nr:hypothetical protein [Paenibacillus polymyxa]